MELDIFRFAVFIFFEAPCMVLCGSPKHISACRSVFFETVFYPCLNFNYNLVESQINIDFIFCTHPPPQKCLKVNSKLINLYLKLNVSLAQLSHSLLFIIVIIIIAILLFSSLSFFLFNCPSLSCHILCQLFCVSQQYSSLSWQRNYYPLCLVFFVLFLL